MFLDKLQVPGRPIYLDNSRIIVGQGPIALAVGAGVVCLGNIFSRFSFLSFLSPSLGDARF